MLPEVVVVVAVDDGSAVAAVAAAAATSTGEFCCVGVVACKGGVVPPGSRMGRSFVAIVLGPPKSRIGVRACVKGKRVKRRRRVGGEVCIVG